MNRREWTLGWRTWLVAAALGLCWLPVAEAGLPEPGMLLYGRVLTPDGEPVYSGELEFSFVREGATEDEGFRLRTNLRRIEAPGGPYAYTLSVPFERIEEGHTSVSGAIEASADAIRYVRTASVTDTAILMEHRVSLSAEQAGTIRRVDVCNTCPESALPHSADVDEDFKFSLLELLRVIQFYAATPDHAYHSDQNTLDGYAPGVGPEEGEPHNADYDAFPIGGSRCPK